MQEDVSESYTIAIHTTFWDFAKADHRNITIRHVRLVMKWFKDISNDYEIVESWRVSRQQERMILFGWMNEWCTQSATYKIAVLELKGHSSYSQKWMISKVTVLHNILFVKMQSFHLKRFDAVISFKRYFMYKERLGFIFPCFDQKILTFR